MKIFSKENLYSIELWAVRISKISHDIYITSQSTVVLTIRSYINFIVTALRSNYISLQWFTLLSHDLFIVNDQDHDSFFSSIMLKIINNQIPIAFDQATPSKKRYQQLKAPPV